MSNGTPYTAEAIAEQLFEAAKKTIHRCTADMPDGEEKTKLLGRFFEAYMTGTAQAAAFLTRAEGAVTPQIISKAIGIVAQHCGGEIVTPAQADADIALHAAAKDGCNKAKRATGSRLIPRTCQRCKLGPCAYPAL